MKVGLRPTLMSDSKEKTIGLALSGGGVRAAIFHLGVLARLAKDNKLESIKFISTVSGGSLAVGLIYAHSGNKWPTSNEYLTETIGKVREKLLSSTVQWSYTWRSMFLPWRLLRGRAHILASVIKQQWGIDFDLNVLSDSPRWLINATCFETGKNWRFSKARMGDYKTHYVVEPSFPIADAIAASAAVPGLVGPLVLNNSKFTWQKFTSWESTEMRETEQKVKKFHLWDGGVYDNLGVEALYKPTKGNREGLDCLIVSDASMPLHFQKRKFRKSFIRLTDIATDQARSVRARTLYESFLKNDGSGAFLRIGNTSSEIYRQAKANISDISISESLSDSQVHKAGTFDTTLRQVRDDEFTLLFRHGYEVADATLSAYLPNTYYPKAYRTPEMK